jgi:tRNA(His) guanylyltransferase
LDLIKNKLLTYYGILKIMKRDNLGDRMKGYENVFKQKLLRRTPVIIRVDGKAFHTFTKILTPEFDPTSAYGPSERMHKVMMQTAKELCENIQNCVFAYTQSDEISLLLRDWDKLTTDQWFDGTVQKIASVSAAMATSYFAHAWHDETNIFPKAVFDSRVYNLPPEEVVNYFIWRQQDTTRNSVQFIARKYFSHKQLHGKNNSEIQEMLFHEHDCNWNDYAIWKKRGACVYRDSSGFTTDRDNKHVGGECYRDG